MIKKWVIFKLENKNVEYEMELKQQHQIKRNLIFVVWNYKMNYNAKLTN